MTFQPLFEDEGIPLAVMGMLVVFAALVFVSVFIALLPRMTDAVTRWIPEERPAAKSKKVAGDALSDETIVVIAAAVMEVVEHPHRIVHIDHGVPASGSWGIEGRRQHHASHSPHRQSPKS